MFSDRIKFIYRYGENPITTSNNNKYISIIFIWSKNFFTFYNDLLQVGFKLICFYNETMGHLLKNKTLKNKFMRRKGNVSVIILKFSFIF